MALVLVVLIPGVSGAHAAPAPAVRQAPIGGTLASEASTNGVTTLVVTTKNHGQVTVNVSSGTIFVRRYNGASALDELNLGDQLEVRGSFAAGSTTVFNATRIKDFSIQEAATRAVLQVSTVNTTTNSFTGVVLRDKVFHRVTPVTIGQTVTVTVGTSGTPTTRLLMMSSGRLTDASFGTLAVGQTVTVLGVYDRKMHTYTTTRLVRIHS